MEEDKAAAYYEELTRKGEGAARFKQGLGFSSSKQSSSDTITKGSALPSSSSFLSSFVRASSPSKLPDIDKQSQLESIQNKLKKKKQSSRVSDNRRRDDDRDRDRDRSSRRRRSRSRDRDDSRRDRDIERKRRRSRSRSYSRERHGGRGRRSRSRSLSPKDRKLEKRREEGKKNKEKNGGGVDYSKLIKGYAEMNPAERVRAKMKLQLSQTAEKDTDKGMGAGWERFAFNKDAPLDDEEIEAAEDDALVVKKMGQSFRFSAIQAKREEQIKAAHDEAMFGAPVAISTDIGPTLEDDDRTDTYGDDDKKESSENGIGTNLVSEKVLAKQQGSWRDRARKLKDSDG